MDPRPIFAKLRLRYLRKPLKQDPNAPRKVIMKRHSFVYQMKGIRTRSRTRWRRAVTSHSLHIPQESNPSLLCLPLHQFIPHFWTELPTQHYNNPNLPYRNPRSPLHTHFLNHLIPFPDLITSAPRVSLVWTLTNGPTSVIQCTFRCLNFLSSLPNSLLISLLDSPLHNPLNNHRISYLNRHLNNCLNSFLSSS